MFSWCALQPAVLEPGERSVIGVSAEIGGGASYGGEVVAFLDEVAARLGGPTPRPDPRHRFEVDFLTPCAVFMPSSLRAGTCGEGWCSASNRSEASGPTVDLAIGLRRRVDGDWRLAPLSSQAIARLESGWNPAGGVRPAPSGPIVGVVRFNDRAPVRLTSPPVGAAHSPWHVVELVRRSIPLTRGEGAPP